MTASGINRAGSAPRLRRFLELASRHNPVNLGDIRTGSTFSQTRKRLLEAITDGTVLHAVFSSTRDVASFLTDLKAEDLGISIVVSGLLDACRRIAARTGLKPHTVAVSLGIWGRDRDSPRAITSRGHVDVRPRHDPRPPCGKAGGGGRLGSAQRPGSGRPPGPAVHLRHLQSPESGGTRSRDGATDRRAKPSLLVFCLKRRPEAWPQDEESFPTLPPGEADAQSSGCPSPSRSGPS